MIVYPKHPTADDTYFIDGAWAPAAITAVDKRFSEAELCAEFYMAATEFQSAHSMDMIFEDSDSEARLDRARDWMFWTERFATLPHHDQETA